MDRMLWTSIDFVRGLLSFLLLILTVDLFAMS
jgi:hypothetical protein